MCAKANRHLMVEIKQHYALNALNTFQVEAYAEKYVRFTTEDQIIGYLTHYPIEDCTYLVLGGGSNLLFVNNFNGTILHPALNGICVLKKHNDNVLVKAMAGEKWDSLVSLAVDNGWGGIENLSLIPGTVGASVVQNIGAYGMEVKDAIECVEAISIPDRKKVTLSSKACGFSYRYSHFRGSWKDRYIITAVVFRLSRKPKYVTHYPGVKEEIQRIGTLNLTNMRKAIIHIRKSKLPDPATVGNAGSFFKNPTITRTELDRLSAQFSAMPAYPQADNRFRIPASWLIEQCGWRGKTFGNAGVYGKHALVLINLGAATGQEIFELSERIRRSVNVKFGIDLQREVQVVKSDCFWVSKDPQAAS